METFKQESKITRAIVARLFTAVFLFFCFIALMPFALAANIDLTEPNHWAWNDIIGWIDFSGATVTNPSVTGVVTSGVGQIVLNCASSPNPVPDCGLFPDWRVQNNGYGILSGYAWGENVGWIKFSGNEAQSIYETTIDADGNFSGFAWNDIIGWISFNSADIGSPITYKTNTTWRTTPAIVGEIFSSVYDSGVEGGVTINSILWQGSEPTRTSVKFQLASSNCLNGANDFPSCSVGTWNFIGPGSSTTTYYVSAGPNISIPVDRADHNNKRYFRYKARLESDALGTVSPRVDDIIINWSP